MLFFIHEGDLRFFVNPKGKEKTLVVVECAQNCFPILVCTVWFPMQFYAKELSDFRCYSCRNQKTHRKRRGCSTRSYNPSVSKKLWEAWWSWQRGNVWSHFLERYLTVILFAVRRQIKLINKSFIRYSNRAYFYGMFKNVAVTSSLDRVVASGFFLKCVDQNPKRLVLVRVTRGPVWLFYATWVRALPHKALVPQGRGGEGEGIANWHSYRGYRANC